MIGILICFALLLGGCSSSDDNGGGDGDGGGNNADCGCTGGPEIDDEGIVFTFQSQEVEQPANVTLFFKLEETGGTPLPDIPATTFTIRENGQEISPFESQQTIRPKPGAFTAQTLLLLDLSGSVLQTNTLARLQEAAQTFIGQIMPRPNEADFGAFRTAIQWFDGAADPHPLVDFTADMEKLNNGIESLNAELSEDPSTNLYGAVIQGVNRVRDEVNRASAAVSAGSLVVFTDGMDQAARRTLDDALNAVRNAEDDDISIYTIGLGNDTDEGVLARLGADGFFKSDNLDGLVSNFQAVARSITADVNSNYILEYCSPKRQGAHDLTVAVEVNGQSGSLTNCFCADGFTGGCQIDSP
jgi:uncharacterized protein YegL